MAQTLNEQVLEHIECSHAALDAANQELVKAAEQKQAAAALIPEATEAATKHLRIDPNDREKMATMLQDPVQVMKILIKMADPNNTITPRPLGSAPAAQDNGRTKQANYCGEKTTAQRESDRRFRETLLGS